MTTPIVTARAILDRRVGCTMYVADGPDDHTWLLSRLTEAAAIADGTAYLLATREIVDGKWVLR